MGLLELLESNSNSNSNSNINKGISCSNSDSNSNGGAQGRHHPTDEHHVAIWADRLLTLLVVAHPGAATVPDGHGKTPLDLVRDHQARTSSQNQANNEQQQKQQKQQAQASSRMQSRTKTRKNHAFRFESPPGNKSESPSASLPLWFAGSSSSGEKIPSPSKLPSTLPLTSPGQDQSLAERIEDLLIFASEMTTAMSDPAPKAIFPAKPTAAVEPAVVVSALGDDPVKVKVKVKSKATGRIHVRGLDHESRTVQNRGKQQQQQQQQQQQRHRSHPRRSCDVREEKRDSSSLPSPSPPSSPSSRTRQPLPQRRRKYHRQQKQKQRRASTSRTARTADTAEDLLDLLLV